MTRRQFLAALAGGAFVASGVDAFAIEPGRLTVTRHAFGAGDGGGASGAGGGATLRLVQLTDLHLHEVGDYEAEVARAVRRLEPDLVLCTGDMIEREEDLGLLGAFLDLLDPDTRKLGIFGNWERWAKIDPARLAEVYKGRNGRLLVNETFQETHGGRPYAITGLDDLARGRPDLDRAVEGVDPGPNHLLLEHCPAFRDAIPDGSGPGWMLAGHTHGGQITLFGWAPVRPHGSGRYVAGWYRDARPAMYVCRGIGTVGIPARFFAPPEVAAFDWRLA
ncbi:MAG: metallophosphoesterase [Gemmatimonadota bacterium]